MPTRRVTIDHLTGGQVHIAFAADCMEQVDSEGYYGAFVLDPDGHNVEAVFHA